MKNAQTQHIKRDMMKDILPGMMQGALTPKKSLAIYPKLFIDTHKWLWYGWSMRRLGLYLENRERRLAWWFDRYGPNLCSQGERRFVFLKVAQ